MIPQDAIDKAVKTARGLRDQGYFAKVALGDGRAASLFARLVAYTVNPMGYAHDFGWLTKQSGETHYDGYADGAIVYGDVDSDLMNVLKIVTQVGSTAANIGSSVQERRSANHWAKPVALTAEELAYLRPGGGVPVPSSQLEFPPRDLGMQFVAKLDEKYRLAGRRVRTVTPGDELHVDNEGLYVWIAEYQRHFVVDHPGLSVQARHDAAVASVFSDIDKIGL